jgi:CheY-like chemotaxis protein
MSKKTVMVVDDGESLLILVKAVLESEGFKNQKPDLILMDMMMPGMSGRETTEKIRADPKTKKLKVAFLTVARFSETGKSVLKEMNVIDYITKPFDNKEFVKRVKKIVGS